MKARLKNWIAQAADRFGYSITRKSLPPDMGVEFIELYQRCSPFSMTSIERMFGLYTAVAHIAKRGIPGDFVECGVWQGGSAMMMASALSRFGVERKIWLYDTFSGMTEPTSRDMDFGGEAALGKWQERLDTDGNQWCRAELESVKRNMARTGYREDAVRYVQGPVEQTLAGSSPDQIALLRLDTDWYESTRVELEVLYPKLVIGGVLIVDDYGHWQGARQAVDEYFASGRVSPLLLNRLDYTGRIAIRCE